MKITREALTSWVAKNLRLSRIDRRFFTKVEENINLGSITTNQASLWSRLIEKYTRQLTKNGINPVNIACSWGVPVVDSTQLASLSLSADDEDLLFKISWDPRLISLFSATFPSTSRSWFKDTGWVIPYTLTNLRLLSDFIRRYVPYCEIASPLDNIVSTLSKQKWREWKTTAVPYGNGQWMVNCLTEPLVSVLPKSAVASITTVIKLANAGVDIDPRIKRSLRKRYGRHVALLTYDRTAAFRTTKEANLQIMKFCKLAKIKKVAIIASSEPAYVAAPPTTAEATYEPEAVTHLLEFQLATIDVEVRRISSPMILADATYISSCDLVIGNMKYQLSRVPPTVRTLKYYHHANL